MADQDFNITIKTIADTTGIRLTQQGLDAIKIAALQGNQQAIASLKQLTQAANQAKSEMSSIGAGVGVGTIVGLLTGAISRWQAFLAEEDKIIEKMSEVTRKNYELAQSIIETQDALISQRRTATEPLADSYIRLQQELIRLQTEQKSLDLPNQSKEWEDYQKKINATTSEIEKLKSKLKSAGITDVTPTTPGPKAGKGESQALVDEIERNRKAFEEQQKEEIWEIDPETGAYRRTGQKRFPLFQAPPQPQQPAAQQDWTTGAGKIGVNWKDLFKQAFDESMAKYWGP